MYHVAFSYGHSDLIYGIYPYYILFDPFTKPCVHLCNTIEYLNINCDVGIVLFWPKFIEIIKRLYSTFRDNCLLFGHFDFIYFTLYHRADDHFFQICFDILKFTI